MADILTRLEATIAARRSAATSASYVAALLAKGTPKIAQKLGEEAVETVIAALSGDRPAIAAEAADLLFHLLVLLNATGVSLAQVLAELDRREGVSGIDEKASRTASPAIPAVTAAPPEPTPSLALGGTTSRRPLIRKG